MIQLTLTSADGDIVAQLNVDPQQTVESIAPFLQEQFGIPRLQQLILHNGRPLRSDLMFSATGVQNDDLLVIMRTQTASPPLAAASPASAETARPGMRFHDIPPNVSPELLLSIMDMNPQLLQELQTGNPKLAQALQTKNVADVRMALLEMHMEEAARKFKEQEEIRSLEQNPFEAAAQVQIEERIRLSNVQKNMEIAIEEMPEAFARVYMLYIPCEVNGVSVKSFVDSGAQFTIMSSSCAERCGIMRLVDKRFAGQAVGVGTAKIIGRVHMAPLKIGDQFYNCSFTILDQQSVDFLFGLDMLKRHQCCIDLNKNVLSLRDGSGTHEVAFLPEHEIPTSETGEHAPNAPVATQLPTAPASAVGTAPLPVPTETRAQQVQHLIALGFGEQQATAALASTNGNVEQAAALLFESMG